MPWRWRWRNRAALTRLFVAPGNPGTAAVAENVAARDRRSRAIVDFCRLTTIGLVVVGPEAPLVAGLADDLAAAGVPASARARRRRALEGSKGFTKDFCREFGIPTADYRRFSDAAPRWPMSAQKARRSSSRPTVWPPARASSSRRRSPKPSRRSKRCSPAVSARRAREVVIEEFLEGEEVSFFALSDGERAVPFASAQDHKRVGDGDTGPNTGGMGAYSPPPADDADFERARHARDRRADRRRHGAARRAVSRRAVRRADDRRRRPQADRVQRSLRRSGERRSILARLDDDLLELLLGCARGELPARAPRFSDEAALTVVLAARGYPGAVDKGTPIRGLEAAAQRAWRRHPACRHAARRRRAGRRRRARPRRHRARPRRRRRRRRAPMRRSIASTGRAASAVATSAGAPSRAKRGVLNGREDRTNASAPRRIHAVRRDRAWRRRRARPRAISPCSKRWTNSASSRRRSLAPRSARLSAPATPPASRQGHSRLRARPPCAIAPK